MKRFLAVLLLISLSAAAQEPQRFSKSKFWTEALTYSIANAGDGYTTVAAPAHHSSTLNDGSVIVFRRYEGWSPWLYGKYPTPLRYSLVAGGIQAGTMLLSYRLQHCQSRTLRVIGHGLMLGGTAIHSSGAIHNATSH